MQALVASPRTDLCGKGRSTNTQLEGERAQAALRRIGDSASLERRFGGDPLRRSWLRLFWLTVVLTVVLAGYLASSGLGERLLHDEIETQLSRLLQGRVEIASFSVAWQEGLLIEARQLSAFPGTDSDSPPALRARHVRAWIDFMALLVGRLQMSTLELEGPHLRLMERADGSLVGFPALDPIEGEQPSLDARSPAEHLLARLTSLDTAALGFSTSFRAADRVQLIDGVVEWSRSTAEAAGATLRIDLLNGIADRHWLSEAITLDFRGVLSDGVHSPSPFDIGIHRAEHHPFVWTLGVEKIPLALVSRALAESGSDVAEVEGQVDARMRLHTDAEGVAHLSVQSHLEDLRLDAWRETSIFEDNAIDLDFALSVEGQQIRLATARLRAAPVEIEIQGTLGRPLRSESPLHLEAHSQALDLRAIRDWAHAAQEQSKTALTIARLTGPVVSGRVGTLGLSGTAPLVTWQELVGGRLPDLPKGFVLSGAFDGIELAGEPDERIEAITGKVEWVEDRIALHDFRGLYGGEPLPELDAVVHGLSILADRSDAPPPVLPAPPALPGLAPLFELLKPRDPNTLPPVATIDLDIEALNHPLFGWPLRELRARVELPGDGTRVTIHSGRWGDFALSGKMEWVDRGSRPSISATLQISDPPLAASPTTAEAAGDSWGSGRFEIAFRPRRWLPFEKATGFLKLEGSQLFFDELELTVQERGTLAARLSLNFDEAEAVHADTSFALTGGRLQEIGPFVALPEGVAEGAIDASGSLIGRLRPDTPFISELKGSIRAEARDGRIRTNVPLAFRLAKATEGYNPFAGEDRLSFESMKGQFSLDHGQIAVDDLEIEGPLRVYAKVDINTLGEPASIRAVVGIFLFRRPNQLLDGLPLISSFLPGSDRGLIGTYFQVDGPLAAPQVEAMPLQTLMSSVPDVIKAPFKVLRRLFDVGRSDS